MRGACVGEYLRFVWVVDMQQLLLILEQSTVTPTLNSILNFAMSCRQKEVDPSLEMLLGSSQDSHIVVSLCRLLAKTELVQVKVCDYLGSYNIQYRRLT